MNKLSIFYKRFIDYSTEETHKNKIHLLKTPEGSVSQNVQIMSIIKQM